MTPVQTRTCSVVAALVFGVGTALAAESRPPAETEADELYRLGAELFEQLAPAEVKAQFEFPTKEQWDAFAGRLERALAGDSMAELAALAAEARQALVAFRAIGGFEDVADWLEQRLDEAEAAQQIARAPASPPAVRVQPMPHYDLWLGRVRQRPPPPRAAELVPRLREIFAEEGVPPELVWIAEAESSFNPAARSPAGAKGLFQFMPETARAQGLSTWLPDERTHPEKSARAAARYLRQLHRRFGNWALVLAAYNAGEGRVGRTLAARKANTYSAIAAALPAETRMYVPKVCALIAARAGVPPWSIPAPRAGK